MPMPLWKLFCAKFGQFWGSLAICLKAIKFYVFMMPVPCANYLPDLLPGCRFYCKPFLQLLSSFLLFVECDSIHCHLVKSYLLKHIRMLLLMREQRLDFWAGQCLCLFTDTPGGVIWKLLSHQLNFYTACYFKCDASIILDKNVNDCNVACIDLLILNFAWIA